MRKITLLIGFFVSSVLISAQTVKLTFEDNTLNGASVPYGGSVSVVTNPYTTGINSSSYCIDVSNTGYAPVKFSTLSLSSGDKATYKYVTLNVKYCYVDANTGTDLDYPQLDIYSMPAAGTLDATTKITAVSNVWGTAASNVGIWKQVSFTFSSSLLSTIPEGVLVLKLAKQKLHYLIDDVELVAAPSTETILTVENFESKTIGDAFSYVKYWSTTTAGGGTCVVAVDPLNASGKAVKITPTDYNGVIAVNATLPTGKTIANYDKIYFDVYSVSALYAQLLIKSDESVVFQTPTNTYPSQGAAATWNTISNDITGITSSNSVLLRLGYTSNNSVEYYIDNIKLRLKTTTSVESPASSVLFVYSNGNEFVLSSEVSSYELYNLQGKLVEKGKNVSRIVNSKLNNGVYILKAIVKDQSCLAKIVK